MPHKKVNQIVQYFIHTFPWTVRDIINKYFKKHLKEYQNGLSVSTNQTTHDAYIAAILYGTHDSEVAITLA